MPFERNLMIKENISLPVITLDDILNHSLEASEKVLAACRPLQHFSQYLEEGYYPFFMEQQIDYLTQAQRVVNMILEIELPQLGNVDIECLNGSFIFSFFIDYR